MRLEKIRCTDLTIKEFPPFNKCPCLGKILKYIDLLNNNAMDENIVNLLLEKLIIHIDKEKLTLTQQKTISLFIIFIKKFFGYNFDSKLEVIYSQAIQKDYYTIFRTLNLHGLNYLGTFYKVDDRSEEEKAFFTLCAMRKLEAIERFIYQHNSNNSFNIDAQDPLGMSPLFFATASNQKKLVQLLLKHGANRELKTLNGLTPLIFAINLQNEDLCKYLIENYTFKEKNSLFKAFFSVLLKDPISYSILEIVLINIKAQAPEQAIEIVNTILPNNLHSLTQVLFYDTHSEEERITIANLLIQYGADINKPNSNCSTALMWACSFSTKIAHHLLSLGAKIDTKDLHGFNALYYSIINNKLSLIEYLFIKESENSSQTLLEFYILFLKQTFKTEDAEILLIKLFKLVAPTLTINHPKQLLKLTLKKNFHSLILTFLQNDNFIKFSDESILIQLYKKNLLDYFNILFTKLKQSSKKNFLKDILINKVTDCKSKFILERCFPTFRSIFIDSEKCPDFINTSHTLPKLEQQLCHHIQNDHNFEHFEKYIKYALYFFCTQALKLAFNKNSSLYLKTIFNQKLPAHYFEIDFTHFNVALTSHPKRENFSWDIDKFLTWFDEINFNCPEVAGYKNPHKLTNQGRPITQQDLKLGLVSLIDKIKNKTPFLGTPKENTPELHQFYDDLQGCMCDIGALLEKVDLDEKNSTLVDLAQLGFYCADIVLEIFTIRTLLEGGLPKTLENKIYYKLQELRKDIADNLAYNPATQSLDPHRLHQIIYLIGKKYGLPNAFCELFAKPDIFTDVKFDTQNLESIIKKRYKLKLIASVVKDVILREYKTNCNDTVDWLKNQCPSFYKIEFLEKAKRKSKRNVVKIAKEYDLEINPKEKNLKKSISDAVNFHFLENMVFTDTTLIHSDFIIYIMWKMKIIKFRYLE